MLGTNDAIANLAVKDITAARKFYEETLGLQVADASEDGVVTFKSGKSSLMVYESQYAGTNQATSATWVVGNELESIIQDLRKKGVAFQHYDDLPDTTRTGDIHVCGDVKIAWFKDPDGNILSLVNA